MAISCNSNVEIAMRAAAISQGIKKYRSVLSSTSVPISRKIMLVEMYVWYDIFSFSRVFVVEFQLFIYSSVLLYRDIVIICKNTCVFFCV